MWGPKHFVHHSREGAIINVVANMLCTRKYKESRVAVLCELASHVASERSCIARSHI